MSMTSFKSYIRAHHASWMVPAFVALCFFANVEHAAAQALPKPAVAASSFCSGTDTRILVAYSALGATSYDILWCDTDTWCTPNQPLATNRTQTTYTHTGLTPGRWYWYKVRANGPGGSSDWTWDAVTIAEQCTNHQCSYYGASWFGLCTWCTVTPTALAGGSYRLDYSIFWGSPGTIPYLYDSVDTVYPPGTTVSHTVTPLYSWTTGLIPPSAGFSPGPNPICPVLLEPSVGCGSNARAYASTQVSWPSTSGFAFCNDGVGPSPLPAFPSGGGSASWSCAGGYTCTATASYAPRLLVCPGPVTVAVGSTTALTAWYLPGGAVNPATVTCANPSANGGSDYTNFSTWTPTSGTVARVSNTWGSKGVVSGVSPGGPVSVTATYSGLSSSAPVTVPDLGPTCTITSTDIGSGTYRLDYTLNWGDPMYGYNNVFIDTHTINKTSNPQSGSVTVSPAVTTTYGVTFDSGSSPWPTPCNITVAVATLTVTPAGEAQSTGSIESAPVGIICGADCTETYTGGMSVTLDAVSTDPYTVATFSGGCTGINSCPLTMSANKDVTVTFSCDAGHMWDSVYGECVVLNYCGSAHGGTFRNPPSPSILCVSGASSTWVDSAGSDGTFNWTCTKSSISTSCSATKGSGGAV